MKDFQSRLQGVLDQFGIAQAHPMQVQVIRHGVEALEDLGEQPPHYLAHLPTGAGKSLCFMATGVMTQTKSLVIYPLISLMDDQVRRFTEAGIPVGIIRGGQDPLERTLVFHRMARREFLFLLTNPECLALTSIQEHIAHLGFTQAIVDEAHSVVQWGESFRPAYGNLGAILRDCGIPRIFAFSATAGPRIQEQLKQSLFLGSDFILHQGIMDRPGISYHLVKTPAPIDSLGALLARGSMTQAHGILPRPALVFCKTRLATEQLALAFAKMTGDWTRVKYYHAGLSKEEKEHTASWFFHRDDVVLVATCAFGMGVDKKDIRTVVHMELPDTIEAFLQESGRGGRDGRAALSVYLHGPGTAYPQGTWMAAYSGLTSCRRSFLLGGLLGDASLGTQAWAQGAHQTKACCDSCTTEPALLPPLHPDPGPITQKLRHHPHVFSSQDLCSLMATLPDFATWTLDGRHRWIAGMERMGELQKSSFFLWPGTWRTRGTAKKSKDGLH